MLLCLASAIFTLSFIYFVTSFIYGTWVLKKSAPPDLLGNRPETIALLEKNKDDIRPFTFWVAGDPHKDDFLRMLYPEQVKPQHPAFGIVLGDVVVHPLREQHQYFWHEASRWGIDSPVLMVVGNHDVAEADPTGVPGWAPNPFYLNQFEDAYGPGDFSFKYAGCLFIIINDVMEGGDVNLKFLKEVLEEDAPDARMIFVFCHIPPRTEHAVTKYNSAFIPGFADLAEKYRIDYVISGHFHTYVRKTLSGTTYLISGGGTGLAGRESIFLSHGVFFDVDPASRTVTERVMVVYDGFFRNTLYHLGYSAVVDITVFMKSHRFLAVSCYTVNLILLILFLIPTVRRLRRKKDA